MRRTFLPLFLAAMCLLFAAPSQAEARRQPYRPYFAPRPIYPGVYAYPQVVSTWNTWGSPYYFGNPYPTGWYGSYYYNPGAYNYWVSPFGSSYYYTNPRFFYWYGFR